MDCNILLDVAAELGYRLAMNGAETFRIEESISRIMDAYGISAEVFAIPNYLHVSIESDDGSPKTKMRRIGHHGNDLDAVERYSNLSRKICAETPDPVVAQQWLAEAVDAQRNYSMPIYLLGNFMGGCGFCILFGGNLIDSLFAGLCGIVVGLVNRFLDTLKVNPFFRTIAASFLMGLLAYISAVFGLSGNADTVIIGALMILVPGLVFTNAMRDIIYGDTNSGINRIVQVFLVAAAITLGTGAAWGLTGMIWQIPASGVIIQHDLWFEMIACFIACIGFFILFNIHGRGGFLCALGGVLAWITYSLVLRFTANDIPAYFFATIIVALYSEIMARIRKAPAISYLVISIFPLIPGAGVYYTMDHALHSEMTLFAEQGLHTAAIAGVIAVGILLASTAVRLISVWAHHKKG